jgi:hypothetical protein
MPNRRISTGAAAAIIACCAILGGCSSYYKVSEPGGGRVFYTKGEPDRNLNGAVTFTDAKTDAKVTLQSSEITKISSDEFKKETAKE